MKKVDTKKHIKKESILLEKYGCLVEKKKYRLEMQL